MTARQCKNNLKVVFQLKVDCKCCLDARLKGRPRKALARQVASPSKALCQLLAVLCCCNTPAKYDKKTILPASGPLPNTESQESQRREEPPDELQLPLLVPAAAHNPDGSCIVASNTSPCSRPRDPPSCPCWQDNHIDYHVCPQNRD